MACSSKLLLMALQALNCSTNWVSVILLAKGVSETWQSECYFHTLNDL